MGSWLLLRVLAATAAAGAVSAVAETLTGAAETVGLLLIGTFVAVAWPGVVRRLPWGPFAALHALTRRWWQFGQRRQQRRQQQQRSVNSGGARGGGGGEVGKEGGGIAAGGSAGRGGSVKELKGGPGTSGFEGLSGVGGGGGQAAVSVVSGVRDVRGGGAAGEALHGGAQQLSAASECTNASPSGVLGSNTTNATSNNNNSVANVVDGTASAPLPAAAPTGIMRVLFARVFRYVALLQGRSDFTHAVAGTYPLTRGSYAYALSYSGYGGVSPPGGVLSIATGTLPRGAAVAAADLKALARRVHAGGAVVLRRVYVVLAPTAVVTGATAVASATDTAASLAAAAPRTLRAVLWAVRAGLSYKQFQASCYGADTDTDEAYQAALSQLHTYWANQLLEVCRRNGGVYVKAGQFAAAFGGVPREYRTVLSQLEDRAVPKPYKTVRKALERELGGAARVDALFTSFNRRATAAASLAQVHHAVLSDGREVAVKVQYPGLAASVGADLATLKVLSAAAAAVFPAIRLGWLGEELAAKLAVELDFRNEIRNSTRFRAVLSSAGANAAHVVVPQLHEELCSSSVLIMEWVAGCKVTDVETLQRQGINPRQVGRQLLRLFGELMFIQGYVHGDPHPGNLMVRPKGRPSWLRWLFRGSRRGFELVVLDHGTYLEVEPQLRQQFCQLWCAVVMRDEATQHDISLDIGGERAGRILPLLLTQRARNTAEERALRERLGVRTFSDMTSLLAAASRPLVELLRVVTVVRAASAALGVPMAERLRIYSAVAARGLGPRRGGRDGEYLHRSFRSLSYRLRLRALLLGLGVYSWSTAVVGRGWESLVGLIEEALFA